MKAIHRIFSALALAAFLLPLVSCQEKEIVKTPLTMPGNTGYESDYGSISFYWSPVDGAGQYQYIVENNLHYQVAKGFTTATSATVKSLSPATTYTIRIKAIPAVADAANYAGSDYYVFEASTAAPKQYDFAWSHPATIYWDWSNQVHKSSKATFGYDKTLNEYVIAAWGGVMGMDIVFSLSDKGEWLIDYENSTAYGGGPDANMAVALFHGIGGTKAANCWFYTNNTGSSFKGNETGGHAEAWMYNPDGDWTGYYLDYGEYTPDPPAPFVPEADADESWAKEGTAFFAGEELGPVSITFDAETGLYKVDNWYGEEGHGIAFTRDAETGKWLMDTEKSSAYIDGPYEGTGLYELSHGKYGKGMASTLLLDPSDSGYEGDPNSGDIWATVTDPSGKKGTYVVKWIPETPFRWPCSIYVGGDYLAQGTISYDPETLEYTIDSWHGVAGFGVVFTLSDNGEWLINYEKSTAYLSGPDGNTALGLAHGIQGASLANCWFYENNTGSWLAGDENAGTAGCWMYEYNGNWCEYRIVWEAGSWSADGIVSVWGGEVTDYTELGTATISYDVATDQYTISNWLGAEGYSIVFSLENGAWLLDWEHSPAAQGEPDDATAVSLLHGRTDGSQPNCWYWMSANYSWFDGNPVSGATGCWLRDHLNRWTEYRITW